MPRSSQTSASAAGLGDAGALISTSARRATRSASPGRRRASTCAQDVLGSRSACSASILTPVVQISSSGPTGLPAASVGCRRTPARCRCRRASRARTSARARRRGSPPTTQADLAGDAARRPAPIARRRRRRRSPPLLQIARPWSPTVLPQVSIHRSGRPVTKTTGTPPVSSASSTSRVRSVTVPSVCSRVPSRSVATSVAPSLGERHGEPAGELDGRAVVVHGLGDVVGGLAGPPSTPGPSPRRDRPSAASRCRCGRRRWRARRPAATPELRRRRTGQAGRLGDPDRREVEPGGPADEVVGAVQAEPARRARRSPRPVASGRG